MGCRQIAREKESKGSTFQGRQSKACMDVIQIAVFVADRWRILDVHFDDFLIGHRSRIPRSDINSKLSGRGACTDEPSEQEINCIDLDEPRPRFPRFPRLRRLHEHSVRGLVLLQCIG